MAVMQMQRISICALKENRKAILEKLQALGIMEIDTTVLQDEDLQKMDTSSSRQVFEKQAVMASACPLLKNSRYLYGPVL